MKKYIIVLFSLLALSTSCTDYLDKQPDDMKTDEMVWSSRMETEKYLANCYIAPGIITSFAFTVETALVSFFLSIT